MAGQPFQITKPGAPSGPEKSAFQFQKPGVNFAPTKFSIPPKPGSQQAPPLLQKTGSVAAPSFLPKGGQMPVPAFLQKGAQIPVPKGGVVAPPGPAVNIEFKAGPVPVMKAGAPVVNDAECQKLRSDIDEMRVALDNERAKKAAELYKSLVPEQEKADFRGGCEQAFAVVQDAKASVDASLSQTVAVAQQLQQEMQVPMTGAEAQDCGNAAQELQEVQAETVAVVESFNAALEGDMQGVSAQLQQSADQFATFSGQAWEYLQQLMTQMDEILPQVKAKLGKA